MIIYKTIKKQGFNISLCLIFFCYISATIFKFILFYKKLLKFYK
nr:MAG TPA: hypothetical protein [Caudoviricetes sp.]